MSPADLLVATYEPHPHLHRVHGEVLRGPNVTGTWKAPGNRGRGDRCTVLGGGAVVARTSGKADGGRRNHVVQFGGCSIREKG